MVKHKIQNNSKYHVPNLERALKIIELLSNNPQGLTASDISNLLNYPRNSVFRITSTLHDYNYIIRDDDLKTFKLSLKLLSTGIKSLSDQPLVEKALPVMHELQEQYKETIPIGILRGEHGVIIEEVVGTHLFRFVLEPGKIFHLHTSAPGKAMMAYLPDKERKELTSKIKYEVFNERTIRNPNELEKKLKDVKRKGYAVDHAEEIDGMHCIGAPIFNKRGYPVAAIWITGPSMRIKEKDFKKIGLDIRVGADKISRSLGFKE
ncbi:IclR family transcriptional regulator [Bacteroidota bacterium]